MNWLRTLTVLALAILWLPVSVHCQLEQLPGLEFLSCCEHEDTDAPHQDDDCDADACAVIESGLYKLEEQPVSCPVPVLCTVEFALLSEQVLLLPGAYRFVPDTDPPALSRTWQFTFRAALPPRAPSPVS